MPFFTYFTISSWRQFVWFVALFVTLLVGSIFELKAGFFGMVAIGLLHPLWLSMRMQDLANTHAVVPDSRALSRTVYVQGIPVPDTVDTLHNAFFYSPATMGKVLRTFASTRLALYLGATVLALIDVRHSGLQWSGRFDLMAAGPLLALALALFFALRSRRYYRLWLMARQQSWLVCTAEQDGATLYAAYKPLGATAAPAYAPFLAALFTPALAAD